MSSKRAELYFMDWLHLVDFSREKTFSTSVCFHEHQPELCSLSIQGNQFWDICLLPSEKGTYSKKQQFAPLASKLFSLEQAHFQIAHTVSKLIPLECLLFRESG